MKFIKKLSLLLGLCTLLLNMGSIHGSKKAKKTKTPIQKQATKVKQRLGSIDLTIGNEETKTNLITNFITELERLTAMVNSIQTQQEAYDALKPRKKQIAKFKKVFRFVSIKTLNSLNNKLKKIGYRATTTRGLNPLPKTRWTAFAGTTFMAFTPTQTTPTIQVETGKKKQVKIKPARKVELTEKHNTLWQQLKNALLEYSEELNKGNDSLEKLNEIKTKLLALFSSKNDSKTIHNMLCHARPTDKEADVTPSGAPYSQVFSFALYKIIHGDPAIKLQGDQRFTSLLGHAGFTTQKNPLKGHSKLLRLKYFTDKNIKVADAIQGGKSGKKITDWDIKTKEIKTISTAIKSDQRWEEYKQEALQAKNVEDELERMKFLLGLTDTRIATFKVDKKNQDIERIINDIQELFIKIKEKASEPQSLEIKALSTNLAIFDKQIALIQKDLPADISEDTSDKLKNIEQTIGEITLPYVKKYLTEGKKELSDALEKTIESTNDLTPISKKKDSLTISEDHKNVLRKYLGDDKTLLDEYLEKYNELSTKLEKAQEKLDLEEVKTTNWVQKLDEKSKELDDLKPASEEEKIKGAKVSTIKKLFEEKIRNAKNFTKVTTGKSSLEQKDLDAIKAWAKNFKQSTPAWLKKENFEKEEDFNEKINPLLVNVTKQKEEFQKLTATIPDTLETEYKELEGQLGEEQLKQLDETGLKKKDGELDTLNTKITTAEEILTELEQETEKQKLTTLKDNVTNLKTNIEKQLKQKEAIKKITDDVKDPNKGLTFELGELQKKDPSEISQNELEELKQKIEELKKQLDNITDQQEKEEQEKLFKLHFEDPIVELEEKMKTPEQAKPKTLVGSIGEIEDSLQGFIGAFDALSKGLDDTVQAIK